MEPNIKAAELYYSLSLNRVIICFEHYDVILKIKDWMWKNLNSVLCHSKQSLSPAKNISMLMTFREVKAVYFQNHEKNSTE